MINVITFAAHLTNELTKKIDEKFAQSVDDYFTRISKEYNKSISYLEHNSLVIKSSNQETYIDGSLKNPNNLWDILTQEHKEEADNLMNLVHYNKTQANAIRKYLLPLARNTQTVNENYEVTSYELDSYVKFFNCLPDFITQDTELLLRQPEKFEGLTQDDLYRIEQHALTMNQDEIKEFVDTHKSEEIDKVLSSLYSLEFLVNF